MPNHITNCLEIKHEDKNMFNWLVDCWDAKENYLDFNKIVPQPLNLYQGNFGAKERELCKREGRPNWFDWNPKFWGTKWNSYDGKLEKAQDGIFACRFFTAWSPPFPIIDTLISMGFKVSGCWKDECDSEIHEFSEADHGWRAEVTFEYFQ